MCYLTLAFDTTDHTILFERLDNVVKAKETTLSCLRPYLTNCYQFVDVNDNLSSHGKIQFAVLQGFFLGPLFFFLYMLPLSDIIHTVNMVLAFTVTLLKHSCMFQLG